MKKNIKIVLFGYNFPHRKTVDIIKLLYSHRFSIALILAANYITIKSPKSAIQLKKKKITDSTKDLAKKYKIPFYVVKHNSNASLSLLQKYNINFGIIGGARILSKSIIDAIKFGILNTHPGLLPDIRGLDSILWSIYKNHPLGVTVHLINDKIDGGFLVLQKDIKISLKDTLSSLYEKSYQLQLDLIPISLNLILRKTKFKILEMGEYNTKMSYSNQEKVMDMLETYIQNKYCGSL